MAKLQNNCDLVSTTPTGSAVGSSQGLVLVQSFVGGPTTSVTFTGLAKYPYTNYKLIISNFSTTTGGLGAQLTVSTNNGAAYLSSGYQSANSLILTYNGGSFSNATSSTAYFGLSINVAAGTNATFNMDIDLFNMNSSTRLICCVGNSTFYDGTNTYYGFITGNYNSMITANAIQLIPISGSGTFTANFYLYGYNQ